MAGKGGRPLELERVIDRQPILDGDGNETGDYHEVTAGERLLESVGTRGFFVDRAARSVGIAKSTWYAWQTQAAKARAAQANGLRVTRTDQALVEFMDALEVAEEAWHDREWAKVEAATRGAVTTTTTRKYAPGAEPDDPPILLEETVVEKRQPGSVGAIFWRLRHKWPDLYRETLAVTGADGGPLEVTHSEADLLAAEAEAFTAGAAAARKVHGNGNGAAPRSG